MDARAVVAKRLKEARLRAGMSQKQLGIKAGFDEFSASPRINQYERGKHTPDLSTVERLGKVLKVPAPYFYARDDSMAKAILLFGSLPPKTQQRATVTLEAMITQH